LNRAEPCGGPSIGGFGAIHNLAQGADGFGFSQPLIQSNIVGGLGST
jgi:hypothetical protein